MLVPQALQKANPLSLVSKLLRLSGILYPGTSGAVQGLLGLPPRDGGPEACAGDFGCVFCVGGRLETSSREHCCQCWVYLFYSEALPTLGLFGIWREEPWQAF